MESEYCVLNFISFFFCAFTFIYSFPWMTIILSYQQEHTMSFFHTTLQQVAVTNDLLLHQPQQTLATLEQLVRTTESTSSVASYQ